MTRQSLRPDRCPACKRDTVRIREERGIVCRTCAFIFEPPREPGPIRLACNGCEREDYNGVFALPDEWREITEERDDDCWFNFVGTCPTCAVRDDEERAMYSKPVQCELF